MKSDPPAPVRTWLSRIPDAAFLAILGAIAAIGIAGLNFAWSFSERMARVEERVEAIADRVGVNERPRHARR